MVHLMSARSPRGLDCMGYRLPDGLHFWGPSSPTIGQARPRATCSGRATSPRPGHFIDGYESLWLPRVLLTTVCQREFVDALFGASRKRSVELHFQKGLAGAPVPSGCGEKRCAVANLSAISRD
jgi:hypothetical protein